MKEKEDKLAAVRQIHIDEFDYPLPDERIAKYPLSERDKSKLLQYRDGKIEEGIFKEMPDFLPSQALVVFNDTRVIQARLLFTKETGAHIEIFCLEPAKPRDYQLNFQARKESQWLCLVGNLKRWKRGVLKRTFAVRGDKITLSAERLETYGQSHLIKFSWDCDAYTFADVLDATGILPIPPYLHRDTEESDLNTYQTVYSKIKGSVAAPTAGLHFTAEVLDGLDKRGFKRAEVTLHVGAGTFKPVQAETIGCHEMHTEFISVCRHCIEQLMAHPGNVIAVGTTSVRTLESLYYIGRALAENPDASPESLVVGQWVPYEKNDCGIDTPAALQNILDYLGRKSLDRLVTSTQIMIVPGYKFHVVNGIITNFHQPKSTLLLLVSAFVGNDWRKIYDYALAHNFRFLSYGDGSLLIQR